MRLLGYLALIALAACNGKHKSSKDDTSTSNAADPWAVAKGSAASESEPSWVNDPPEVIRDKVVGVNAHVVVLKQLFMPEYRDVLAVVERTSGVVAAEPFVFAELEIARPGKAPMSVAFKGVDPKRVGRVLTVGRHMTAGTLDSLATNESALVLGDVLAQELSVRIGDEVTATLPGGGSSATSKVFRVTGIFHMGFVEYDDRLALTSLSAAQAMLGRGDEALGIEATVKDLEQADEIAAAIEHALGGPPYVVQDWYELNRELFRTLFGDRRP